MVIIYLYVHEIEEKYLIRGDNNNKDSIDLFKLIKRLKL